MSEKNEVFLVEDDGKIFSCLDWGKAADYVVFKNFPLRNKDSH